MMLFPKLTILLLLLVVLQETSAVRGALFRSGRAVPFERVPGQQRSAPLCREVELFVPCLFSFNRNCIIDKLCVHETPVTENPPLSTPSTKRQSRQEAFNKLGPPRDNDFLRFGRAVMASGVGGGSEGNGPDDMKSFLRINGEPEIIFQ